MEAQEWLEALQSVDERVRVLESRQSNIAQGIARNTEDIENMKSKFHEYRNKVAEDITGQLYNNPDSFKIRIDGIEQQLLNEIPEMIIVQMSQIDRRIVEIEASINAIVSEVTGRGNVQQHVISTPAATDPWQQQRHDPWTAQ